METGTIDWVISSENAKYQLYLYLFPGITVIIRFEAVVSPWLGTGLELSFGR